MVEIIKLEKGKEGLEDMKKKQEELEVANFGQKKEKSAKPELVVKKTLEVKGKETKIVSTIKKGGATSKKAQSKKIKKMPKSVESSGNLAKKRVNPKKVVSKRKSPFKIPEAEEKVVISKK